MPLSVGDKLGPYEILALLGKGGMGEVYRARDTRLDRQIAIKVLPAALAQDAERLARFEREAKVLASLNHPNIATIHGVEESSGVRALVMELVPGRTIKGPVPVAEALRLAAQIADALGAAHEKGITHRDLKPLNVMITPEGIIKVLDFGLAAVSQPSGASDGDPSQSPTLTLSATRAGVILGTAAYMSPEQARGQNADRRSDIWAFGVLLYEVLTGQQLFRGDTVSDILASVLKEEPNLERVPSKLRPLLQRCLEKEPRKRLQAIGDWELLVTSGVEPAVQGARAGRSSLFAWGTAALFLLAAAGLSLVHFREEPPRILKLSVLLPESATLSTQSGMPAVSPDGRRVAFVATLDGKTQLWVRDLDSKSARAIAETEGARYPFWSPDSDSIGFSDNAKLKTVSLAGGERLTVCDALQFRGGSWSPKGVIAFGVTNGGILQVPAAGGTPKPVTTPDPATDEGGHRFPWFLPDGHHFLFTATTSAQGRTGGVYIADLDAPGNRKLIASANSNAIYTQPGYVLFVRERTLMAEPFDGRKLQTVGEAVPIADGVDVGNVQTEFEFSASQTGVLAYTSGRNSGGVQLTWIDRSGKPVGTVGLPQSIRWASVSPDGKTVAADQLDPATALSDIWLHDLNRGTASRFTFGPRSNAWPVWSPDGGRIAFFSARPTSPLPHPFVKALSGAAQETTLDDALGNPPRPVRVDDWSRDDRYIIEETNPGINGPNDIWVLPLTDGKPGERKSYPYLHSGFAELFAKLSPDGRWLAYQGNESGRSQVYVQSFPEPGGKWQVSTASGGHPIWSRDGKELYFLSSDLKIMAVDVKSAPGKFDAGVPKALFDVRMRNDPNTWFDVSPDGRFLIPMLVSESSNVPISVVINWQLGLKK